MTPHKANAARAAAAATRNANLIEEIEFLLMCDMGEANITHALGIKPAALKHRLQRIKRPDLQARIFEADQLYHQGHTDMGITATPKPRKAAAA